MTRTRVAALNELRPGRPHPVWLGTAQVLLALVDGTVYAVGAACTHDGAPLAEGDVEGDTIVCPWHFSRFCLRRGTVLESPAGQPIATYRTEVVDGEVFLTVPG